MKEIVWRLKEVEAETDRRSRLKINCYNRQKVHEKQMAFHRDLHRNRWVFGGNRSGKTECGAVETVWLARGIHPFRPNRAGTEGWVVSLSQQVQRDVAQKKVLEYLDPAWIEGIKMLNGKQDSPAYGVIDFILVRNVFGTVSKIGFKSCEAGREKFQGTSLDYVWFDEEPPEDIYEEYRFLKTFSEKIGINKRTLKDAVKSSQTSYETAKIIADGLSIPIDSLFNVKVAKEHYKSSYYEMMKKVIRGTLRYAVKLGVIERNYAEHLYVTTRHSDKKKVNSLTKYEVSKLIIQRS